MILLLLLFSSGSVLPKCLTIQTALIPKQSPNNISCNSKSEYKVNWQAAIVPITCYKHITSVTVYYNGRPGTKCCKGYKNMKKTPSNDATPFILPLNGKETHQQGTPSKLI